MAERFTNFLGTVRDGELTVVPASSSSDDTRTNGSIVQVHSLYLTVSKNWTFTETERTNASNYINANIFVNDALKGKIYVAYGVLLVPGCPFYIEKNITLTENQSLGISVTNSTSFTINAVASAVEFIEDSEEF